MLLPRPPLPIHATLPDRPPRTPDGAPHAGGSRRGRVCGVHLPPGAQLDEGDAAPDQRTKGDRVSHTCSYAAGKIMCQHSISCADAAEMCLACTGAARRGHGAVGKGCADVQGDGGASSLAPFHCRDWGRAFVFVCVCAKFSRSRADLVVWGRVSRLGSGRNTATSK